MHELAYIVYAVYRLYCIHTRYVRFFFPVENAADCDVIECRQDTTLCAEQGNDETCVIIAPDTNHNHRPLLSAAANRGIDTGKPQLAGNRDNVKTSSTTVSVR